MMPMSPSANASSVEAGAPRVGKTSRGDGSRKSIAPPPTTATACKKKYATAGGRLLIATSGAGVPSMLLAVDPPRQRAAVRLVHHDHEVVEDGWIEAQHQAAECDGAIEARGSSGAFTHD